MALNRYRMRHLANNGHHGARMAQQLLRRPDKLIGLILLGNNLVNILAAAIATIIGIRLFGSNGVWIASLVLTVVVLIFAEVTPKTVAALNPERIAYPAAYVLLPMLRLTYPIIWFVNLFVQGILWLLRIKKPEPGQQSRLGLEELRSVVLNTAKPLVLTT